MKEVDELLTLCFQQMTKKIKSGIFNAADINASVNLMKLTNAEISLNNNNDAQNLQTALNDTDTGIQVNFANPPELTVVRSSGTA